ncbi:hypothetical protein SS50377_24821 [Spironucleus salmonicida]|uniref:Uncharacterized protein n=1 Tax=Spironucleus salmonicida TaxID=348837 RepID=V6LVC1_9EUKA|nr:hypothetical protein SS50377_24821 [Spironucleus salmonicida]|eukprot:EST44744.1 Hypothetical protein SS50377_15364 [Spironucleus salmonicida]
MEQKFLVATKEHQIKILGQLPYQLTQFSNENKQVEYRIHSSKSATDFPLVSASAPGLCMISSLTCTQILRSDIFSTNTPSVHFDSNNIPIVTTENGYIAQYPLSLQHIPQKFLPNEHYMIHLALNEKLAGTQTNQGRVIYDDGTIIYIKEKFNLLNLVKKSLFGNDTDLLAQPPLILQEMLKTRNQAFKKKDKINKRSMKDTSDPLYFEIFEKMEKSVVQELQIEAEKVQLEEDLVLQQKQFNSLQVILSEQQITVIYNQFQKKIIKLQDLFSACPTFSFISRSSFTSFSQEGTRKLDNITHYFIPFDITYQQPQIQNMETSKNLIITQYTILTLMIPRSDLSTSKFVLLTATFVNKKLNLTFTTQQNQSLSKSALNTSKININQETSIDQINEYFTNYSYSTQRVLKLSQFPNLSPVLLSTNYNFLLCFDSKIIQFQLEIQNFDHKISVNQVNFDEILQKIVKKPLIERRRILSRIPSEYRNIASELIGMRKLLMFESNGQDRGPTTLRIQNKLEKLFFTQTYANSVHFQLQNCREIIFDEKKEKLNQSVNLLKSVRFSEFSLAKSIFDDKKEEKGLENIIFPSVSAFCLLPMEQIKNNQLLLKNAISSSVFCIMQKSEKTFLISANFNDFSRIKSMLNKNENITAKYVLRSFSAKTNFNYKDMSVQQLLQINFQNYLRNEVLLPMNPEQISSQDIEVLIQQLAKKSVIDYKSDSNWARQVNIFELKSGEKQLLDHQKLLNQYRSANLSKQRDILLLIYFLGEINIYNQLPSVTKQLIRQFFDATSGVDSILSVLIDNIYINIDHVCHFEYEISKNFEFLSKNSAHSDVIFMRNQISEKLSPFEAGLSNLFIQVDNDLFFLKSLQQLLQNQPQNGLYQQLTGSYIQVILSQRLQNLSSLDIISLADHPTWIFSALPILQQLLNTFINQFNINSLNILDGFLFLNYIYTSQTDQVQQFYETRNRFFQVINYNEETSHQVCRIFARYHDFSSFSRVACQKIKSLTFKQLAETIIFGEFQSLNEIIQSENLSICSLENAIEKIGLTPKNIFDSNIREILEEVISEKDTFYLLENVETVISCLIESLQSVGRLVNSAVLRSCLGQKQVVGNAVEKCYRALEQKE